MLFHVTGTHVADDCPGYNPELMPSMVEAIEKSDALASELGIKVHFVVNGAPEHVTYALLETEDSSRIAFWTSSFPIKQDFKVTVVASRKRIWQQWPGSSWRDSSPRSPPRTARAHKFFPAAFSRGCGPWRPGESFLDQPLAGRIGGRLGPVGTSVSDLLFHVPSPLVLLNGWLKGLAGRRRPHEPGTVARRGPPVSR